MRKNKQKKQKSNLGLILKYSITTFLSVLMIIALVMTNMYSGLISNVLDASITKIVNPVDDLYVSDFETYEELVSYQEEIGQLVEEEGLVLLKNENATLPLASTVKNISVFGQSSVDFVYGGSGSGSVSANKAVSLKSALESEGFAVNDTLWNFYETGAGESYRKTFPSETGAGEFTVNEVPASVYTSEVEESFSTYSDAAIVVLGRSGGESADLPIDELPNGYKYLEIDNNERDMLEMAIDNFETVVVVINSSNAMELGFLEEYDVDACIWVGATGQTGIYAVGSVLNGSVNPSGRLVDTYAYDSMSAPSFVNMGNYDITNEEVSWEDKNNKYMVYAEGVYIGYRYYETRYEDTVLDTEYVGEYDYGLQVQFPFGYGMSYTTYEHSNFSVQENEANFTVTLDVSNTGKFAGKEVVQIYMQSPYTEYDIKHGIEKPSVELVGFVKTDIIEAGDTVKVSIDISKEMMKTYDANGVGTYIVDAGDYYFTDGNNAHIAINNILAAKGYTTADGMTADGDKNSVYKVTIDDMDDITYSVSQATGQPIKNEFEDTDIKYYDDDFKYLTRSDWMGTWPTVYADGQWEISDQMLEDLTFYRGQEVINDGSTMPVTDVTPTEHVYVSNLIGADYDDPAWETVLDELSIKKLTKLVRMGGYATIPIDVIGLPPTTDKDGPAGFSSSLIPGRSGMAFPTEVVMASTWNVDLIKEVGRLIGEDSLALGITGWYAPGANIHRSPYSGRNFEYYSEDGFLGGMICAYEVLGVSSKGTLAYMKHFALNDQETNRYGGAIFANEQAIREVFLKSFEFGVREGGITGVMTSMNRLGARWSGAHVGLMTNTLRQEWGFEGVAITDQASVPSMLYQDMISGLHAGTDLWLNTNNSLWSLEDYKDNPTVMTNARNASHNIIYAVANSNAMNGISPDTEIVAIVPWWRKALWAISGIVWLLSAFVIFKTTKKVLSDRKKNQ